MAQILLVEDDLESRASFAALLTDCGHQIIQADDGDQAIKKFQLQKPDLVLTDILMPSKDGIEIILELRKLSMSVPIIAMSGGGCIKATDCLKFAVKCGADQALSKPVSRDLLIDSIEKLLATDRKQ